MLSSLHVENLAVIRSVDIDLGAGFSAWTGETGAGKSVLIDSIGLLLGEKADKEMIRTGEEHAMVSGLFTDLGAAALSEIRDAGVYPDEDGNILVQRTVGKDGRSQVKVNGRSVTLSVLKCIGPCLIHIHGQNDTHTLSDEGAQTALLDTYAGLAGQMAEYCEKYKMYEEISRQIAEVQQKSRDRARLCEMLLYQIRDIDAAGLHEGEEEELVEKKVRSKSRERILKNTTFTFRALRGSEKGNVAFLLDKSAAALSQLSDVYPAFGEYGERLRDMRSLVDDIAEEVYAVSEEAGDGADDIDDIEERLDKISKLKRKYGLTVSDILAFRDRAAEEYKTLENADDTLHELEKRKAAAYEEAASLAKTLHAVRAEAAGRLESDIRETLKFLDMPKVVFFISVREMYRGGDLVLSADGADKTEFFISANSGADPQPIAKIASGGELARIMLAFKCALADKQNVSTLIFDEIDAGVSGKTARKIGLKLRTLAKDVQVLCVTHSAQIASLGDVHFLISKAERDGKTETSVRQLDREGRISELSRILGGLHVTAAQREAAVDMLTERENIL